MTIELPVWLVGAEAALTGRGGGGPLFEGNPVAEGTTRRGTATPVHRPQRPAGRGSGAGTLGVPLGGTRRVGGLLGVAGRLSGTVSPFRAEQGTSLDPRMN